MTIVGPSKSIAVISTWSGTTCFTTRFASLRMSSIVIERSLWAPWALVVSRQLHRCLASLDFLVVEELESVLRDDRDVDSLAGHRVPLHRRGHRADREVRPVLPGHVVLPVVLEDAVHVRAPGPARGELVGEGPARGGDREHTAAAPIPSPPHPTPPGPRTPLGVNLRGRAPPAASIENTWPPLRSHPPITSWTQYGKYRLPERMFDVRVAQASTDMGMLRFSFYSSTSP